MMESSGGLKESDDASTPQRGPDGLYHDLDEFFGTWVEDPEFDKAMEDFERIDPEDWGLEPDGGDHANA
jgi:hypothetical protein